MLARPLLFAALLASVPLGALAQDRTDTELRELFERQRESFRGVEGNPGLGATRGLVLAPVENPEPEAVEVEQATPGLVLDAPEAVPAATHWVLPEDQQVNMRVSFAFDSAAIAESEKPKLRQICSVIDEAGIGLFRIVGHTDATGDAAYNQRLSVRRAEEVMRFFTDGCGISPERLEAIGVGKQFPFNPADPYAGENRRVEFQAIS